MVSTFKGSKAGTFCIRAFSGEKFREEYPDLEIHPTILGVSPIQFDFNAPTLWDSDSPIGREPSLSKFKMGYCSTIGGKPVKVPATAATRKFAQNFATTGNFSAAM